MRGAVMIVVVGLAVWAAAIVLLAVMGRGVAARALARLVPDLVALFRGLVRDPAVPLGSKILLVAAVVWLVSPIDLIPEFIPVLGPLDDAIVAALVLRHLVRRAGVDVVRRHWRGDERTLQVLLRVAGGGRGRGAGAA